MTQAPSTTPSTIPKSKWNDEYDEDDYVQFGGEKDDFMMRFVDSTCQGIMPNAGDEGPCQGILPACEASLDQQLDLFTVSFAIQKAGEMCACISLCE
jgi:hypothetical protein